MTAPDFTAAYAATMGHEGRYSNNAADRGGETWKGVARRANPTWPGWAIVDAQRGSVDFPGCLSLDAELERQVQAIYRRLYWDRLQLDAMPEHAIAAELFDTAVNMGVHTAGTFLQSSLNLLNRNARTYPDLVEDGDVGQQTMAALHELLERDSSALLVKFLNVLQGACYIALMRKDETQEAFARGWFGRVEITKSAAA